MGGGPKVIQAWQFLQPWLGGPVTEKGPGLWAGSEEDQSGWPIIVNPLRDLDFYLERKEKKFMWILEFQGKVSVLSLVWR